MAQRSQADAKIGRDVWEPFCRELGLDQFLTNIKDPVPILQVFFRRVRDGRLAILKQPVRGRSAEAYLRAVGQTFARLGRPDPRLNAHGDQDFRLQRQLQYYKKQDPPSSRRQPIPVELLHLVTRRLRATNSPKSLALANLVWIAFFFLMRPGEFCMSGDEPHPFRFCDVTLKAGNTTLDLRRATDAQLRTATFVILTFTTQKSGVRGEKVGHSRSGTTKACPVAAIAEQIIALRAAGASSTIPLCSYRPAPGFGFVRLTSQDFTNALRVEATIHGDRLGISPKDVSVGCFRTTGAMALFCAGVDGQRIRLLGRWNSWQMLRYLHMQANATMAGFATKMLVGGSHERMSLDPPPARDPEPSDDLPILLPQGDPGVP